MPTIKLAMLSNGLEYQLYSDTIEQNIMDEKSFLKFSLRDIASGQLDDTTLGGVSNLKKDAFDPSAIGSKARENLMLNRFEKSIQSWTETPSDDLVRLFLRDADTVAGSCKGCWTSTAALWYRLSVASWTKRYWSGSASPIVPL